MPLAQLSETDRNLVRKVVKVILDVCGAANAEGWFQHHIGSLRALHRIRTLGVLNAHTHRAIMKVLRMDQALSRRVRNRLSLNERLRFDTLESHLYGGSIDPRLHFQLSAPRAVVDARVIVQHAFGALMHSTLSSSLPLDAPTCSKIRHHSGMITLSIYRALMDAIHTNQALSNVIEQTTCRSGSSAYLMTRLREAERFFVDNERQPRRTRTPHTTTAVVKAKHKTARPADQLSLALSIPTTPTVAPSNTPSTTHVVTTTREAIVDAISAMMDAEIKQATKDRDQRIADLQAQVTMLTQQRDEWEAIAAKHKGVIGRIQDYIKEQREIVTLAGRTQPHVDIMPDEAIAPTTSRRGHRSRPFRTPPKQIAISEPTSGRIGRPPFGYRIKRGHATPHPPHFATLQLIVELHNAGLAMKDIAKRLNQEHCATTAGTLWTTKGLETTCARLRKRDII